MRYGSKQNGRDAKSTIPAIARTSPRGGKPTTTRVSFTLKTRCISRPRAAAAAAGEKAEKGENRSLGKVTGSTDGGALITRRESASKSRALRRGSVSPPPPPPRRGGGDKADADVHAAERLALFTMGVWRGPCDLQSGLCNTITGFFFCGYSVF